MEAFRRWAAAAAFAGSAVYLVYHGLQLVKSAELDETSLEHDRNLFLVNEFNALRGRPPQESLTNRQLRVFGWIYIAVSPLCLLLAFLTAAGVLD